MRMLFLNDLNKILLWLHCPQLHNKMITPEISRKVSARDTTRIPKHFILRQGLVKLSAFPVDKVAYVSLLHLRSVVQIDSVCCKLLDTFSSGFHSRKATEPESCRLVGELAMSVVTESSIITVQPREKSQKIKVRFVSDVVAFSEEVLLGKGKNEWVIRFYQLACTLFIRFFDETYLRITCDSSTSYQKWFTAFKRAFNHTAHRASPETECTLKL